MSRTLAPYFTAGTVALYHGDCLQVMRGLPAGHVDLVFADPPYNLSEEGNQGMARKKRPNSPMAGDKGEWDRMDAPAYQGLICGFLDETWRILRTGGTVIVCCTHHEEDNIKRWLEERFGIILNRLVWHKTNPTPTFDKGRLVWSSEYLFIARKGPGNTVNWGLYPYSQMHDVWTGPICSGQSKERVKHWGVKPDGTVGWISTHPTQKPLWLVEKAVRVFSNPGDLVVDPFAGTATTLEACIKWGRHCIGIEKELTFVAAAARRLDEALKLKRDPPA